MQLNQCNDERCAFGTPLGTGERPEPDNSAFVAAVVRRALASLSDLLSVTAGALVALHRRTAVRREVGSLSRVRGRGLALARRVIAEARAFDLNLRARARRMLDRSHSFGAEPIGQVTICKQYEVGGLHGWYE